MPIEANKAKKTGRPPSGLAPSKKALLRLYVREGKSIREVAEALGVSKDMVYRALRSQGIDVRSNVCRSKLRRHRLKDLEAGISEKGVRGHAKELGIHENTLRNYIRGAKKGK